MTLNTHRRLHRHDGVIITSQMENTRQNGEKRSLVTLGSQHPIAQSFFSPKNYLIQFSIF